MATVLDESSHEFSITQMEMIKGIEGFGFYDECVVPIIQNTARESHLTERLQAAITAYPKSKAVLVRRHGVYVWGKDWKQAKGHAECYDYLFEASVKMRQIGLGSIPRFSTKNGVFSRTSILGTRKRGHVRPEIVVLDIEGTISPVSFRTETVLPLVEQSLKSYLADTFDTKNTQSIIQGIREFELTNGAQGMVPAEHAGKMKVIDGCCNLMDHAKEKKIPPLMHLQGAILEGALTSGDLVASIFKDVPAALKKWRAMGAKLFIYSSLPSGAQRKYLESTKEGNLRQYFSGFLDTCIGDKTTQASYERMTSLFSVTSNDKIAFVTDSLSEAEAASKLGWTCYLADRPGNAKIEQEHDFTTSNNFETLANMHAS